MTGRPTLEDVARLSGVSTATVSRVLNAPGRVKGATRERVERAVAELGYTPHFGAQALASNRTGTIGAVIPTMENAIFARGLQALQEELSAAAHTLLVATSNYDPRRELLQIQTLLGRGVDGLVLIGEARKPEIYRMLTQRGVPFVIVWLWREETPWPCIGFDNRAASRAMTEHVLALGHRRIAMIAGVTRGNDRAAERVVGVREALATRGLPLDSTTLIEAEYTLDAGAAAARHLLGHRGAPTRDRPTALICGNDVLAVGALGAARDLGLDVPRDLSVTGFDNIELAEVVTPALTTVHVPHRRMGQAAAEQLLRSCRGEGKAESRLFKTMRVDRASLDRPPGA